MKKEISTPLGVIVVLILIVGGWFIFQKATGPLKSETPSPDVTKMSTAEIEKIKRNSSPEGIH